MTHKQSVTTIWHCSEHPQRTPGTAGYNGYQLQSCLVFCTVVPSIISFPAHSCLLSSSVMCAPHRATSRAKRKPFKRPCPRAAARLPCPPTPNPLRHHPLLRLLRSQLASPQRQPGHLPSVPSHRSPAARRGTCSSTTVEPPPSPLLSSPLSLFCSSKHHVPDLPQPLGKLARGP